MQYIITRLSFFDKKNSVYVTKVIRVLSKDGQLALERVLYNSTDLYKLGILLCLYTGIRVGELCALKWENISLNNETIQIIHTLQRHPNLSNGAKNKTRIVVDEPKSKSSIRTIPLPTFLVELLRGYSYNTTSKTFFLSGNGNHCIEPRAMQKHFKKNLA